MPIYQDKGQSYNKRFFILSLYARPEVFLQFLRHVITTPSVAGPGAQQTILGVSDVVRKTCCHRSLLRARRDAIFDEAQECAG